MGHGPVGLLARINRRNYDLIPLMGAVGFAVAMAIGYTGWCITKKSDVVVARGRNPYPWQRINSSKPQKLHTINQKWEANPSIEALRRDIGSGN